MLSLPAEVQTEHHNKEERWFNFLWAWHGGVFQKLLIYWDFSHTAISMLHREMFKKEKISSEKFRSDKNAPLHISWASFGAHSLFLVLLNGWSGDLIYHRGLSHQNSIHGGGTRDSHQRCAAEKSTATVLCYHVISDQISEALL